MAQNLIHDGTFDYTDSWITYTSYSDNKIEFLSTGGQGGGCAKLTVRSTGDPGLCSLSQNVYLTPGATYALKFDVKREEDIDLWVQIASANVYNGPSLKPLLTSNDPFYKNVVQKFTMPEASYGETSFLTRVSIIAGSAGGAVWIDNVDLTLESHVINPSTPDYSNCYVESTAYKYSELNLESDHTYALDKGSTVGLYEISNDHFIECRDNGQWFVERKCVNTAKSNKTSTRNAANMFGDTTLKYESPAPEQGKVYNLQWTLNRLGYNCGTVDGKFGKGVDSAVRAFQKNAGLTVDGKVGSGTKAALIAALDALDS